MGALRWCKPLPSLACTLHNLCGSFPFAHLSPRLEKKVAVDLVSKNSAWQQSAALSGLLLSGHMTLPAAGQAEMGGSISAEAQGNGQRKPAVGRTELLAIAVPPCSAAAARWSSAGYMCTPPQVGALPLPQVSPSIHLSHHQETPHS